MTSQRRQAIHLTVRAILLALTTVVAAGCFASASANAAPKPFPFQPISFKRINLPAEIKEATRPAFTNDGKHLLFHFDHELWITSLSGKGTDCLSCGVANSPRSLGEDLATPFPDGKRVFFGGYVQPGAANMAVLECSPSLIDCKDRKISPVDFSEAEPTSIPGGGPYTASQINLLGASSAKLSPDGKHIGFSDLRSDSLLNMVVAKLVRSGDTYKATEPRVINPAGPTSATDPDIKAWSDSSALFEFKSFTHGGADVTYVQVGGINRGPDVWSVNLKTGKRTQLTKHPDWDEDGAVSPDGKYLSLWTNRTMHFADFIGGLLPVRDFINGPVSTQAAGAIGANKMCHGPMWLLPSSGDQGGTLAGEPILNYDYKNVTVTNNLTGAPQWSPNGKMIALNTNYTVDTPTDPYVPEEGKNAPFLLVASLTANKPTKPQKTVSSDVGSWAPTPTDYHGALGYKGTVTLQGPGGGTVEISYGGSPGPGVYLGGEWTETYTNYSDNGKDFTNGTVKITGLTDGTYSAHLTMTGSHTGSQDTELVFKHLHVTGTSKSTLDGKSISGPSADLSDAGTCPSLLPKKPKLKVKSTRLKNGVRRIKVTASIAGMGPSESSVSTQPVRHATLKFRGRSYFTNSKGIAKLKVKKAGNLRVTAGQTLVPAHLHLRS